MQWQGINKDSPENIYFSVYNSGASELVAGEGCKWDLDPANDDGVANWVEAISLVATANGLGPDNFAGVIPQGKTLGVAEYGSMQVFGYHPSVLVKNASVNGFVGGFQAAFNAASITNKILVPFGYGTANAGAQPGYMALVQGQGSTITTGHTPLKLARNYLLPVEQNATVASTTTTDATTDTTTAKAFIRCLG
jgi:hypothetical protein